MELADHVGRKLSRLRQTLTAQPPRPARGWRGSRPQRG
jgi:hypothetical protein